MAVRRPRVSVLMAARNSEATIGAALGSLLRQTTPADEIIVVDDASTDRTATLVHEMSNGSVHFLRNETRLGVARSLNRALAASSGDLVARMDADDVSAAIRLEVQSDFLARRPDIDLVGTWVRTIDARSRPLGHLNLPVSYESILGYTALSPAFRHPTMMIRRSVLDLSGNAYDPSAEAAEDYDLWARLLPFHRAENIPRRLLAYRIHSQSVSVLHRDLQVASHAGAARRFAAMMTGRDDLDARIFDRLAAAVVLRRPLRGPDLEALVAVLAEVNAGIGRFQGPLAARRAAAEQSYMLARLSVRSLPSAVRVCVGWMPHGKATPGAALLVPFARDLRRLADTAIDRTGGRGSEVIRALRGPSGSPRTRKPGRRPGLLP